MFKFDKKDLQRIKNNRRYYSHRMIKKHPLDDVKLNPSQREISCNDIDCIKNKTVKKHVNILLNIYGYNVQTFINKYANH